MKKLPLFALLLSLGMFTVGCNDSADSTPATTPTTTPTDGGTAAPAETPAENP